MLGRIKTLCERDKTNFSKLEKTLGFANGSIKKSKEDTISAIRLKAMADYFHVSMEYLLTGKGNLYQEPAAGAILTYEEMDIIKAYRLLPDMKKDVIADILHIKRQDTGLQSEKVG